MRRGRRKKDKASGSLRKISRGHPQDGRPNIISPRKDPDERRGQDYLMTRVSPRRVGARSLSVAGIKV